MNKSILKPLWIGIVFVFIIPVFSQAQIIGTLTLHKGIVKHRRGIVDMVYRDAGQVVELENGDELQTGAESFAIMTLLLKKDTIELFSKTFLTVNDAGSEDSQIGMPVGKAKFKISKRLKRRKKGKKRFRVKTTTAVIGVKGTEFVLSSGVTETNVLTLEGLVSVANINTPDVEVDLAVNQISQVRVGITPTLPVTASPEVRAIIETTDSPAAFQSATFGEAAPAPTSSNQRSGNRNQQKPGQQNNQATGQNQNQNNQQGSDNSGNQQGTTVNDPLNPTNQGIPQGTEPGSEGGLPTPGEGEANLETNEGNELPPLVLTESDLPLDDEPDFPEDDDIGVDIDDIADEVADDIDDITDEIDDLPTDDDQTVEIYIIY